MDDTCAVCAERFQWVAYGLCGHQDVCSTCVARLRFMCDDRRCCICKIECPLIFVTRAVGNFTRTINDFSLLPSDPSEGQVGSYWFHEDLQAYFDDLDHYKMIKAMCSLSCIVCDKVNQGINGSKSLEKFRNVTHLKSHLFIHHKLFMCPLCLEGRKVFVCEQKLYTREKLNQHVSTGDTEVEDGEFEKGSFMGHPMCEFCEKPFYGGSELYSHMSVEHYTCHFCQRQDPGQYEYYNNYDDLEKHFRRYHFLCEDEDCLAKKFIVFLSEFEFEKHDAKEHGEKMPHSKSNAALKIQSSYCQQWSHEQDHRHGMRWGHGVVSSDNQPPLDVEASVTDSRNSTIIPPSDSSATTNSELPLSNLHDPEQISISASLEDTSFPPLPMAPGSNPPKPNSNLEGLTNTTMASRLCNQNNIKVNVLSSSQAWSAISHGPVLSASSPSFAQSVTSQNYGVVSSFKYSTKPVTTKGPILSSYASLVQARPARTSSSRNSSSSSSASSLSQRESLDSFPSIVEVLPKDGYCAAKGKSKLLVGDKHANMSPSIRLLTEHMNQNESQSIGCGSSNQNSRAVGGNKPKKKTSKFLRVRLGDGSMAALLDRRHSGMGPVLPEETPELNKNRSVGLPVCGVWRNGGGQRLVAMTHRGMNAPV